MENQLNLILRFLYHNHDKQFLPESIDLPEIHTNIFSLLETLYDEKLIFKQTKNIIGGSEYDCYSIRPEIVNEIDSFEDPSFRNNPYSYFRKMNERREQEQKAIDEQSKLKLVYDLKNAERIYKSYWWTFGIAIAGLLISLILLILRFVVK
jgi:hypothetical protein